MGIMLWELCYENLIIKYIYFIERLLDIIYKQNEFRFK